MGDRRVVGFEDVCVLKKKIEFVVAEFTLFMSGIGQDG